MNEFIPCPHCRDREGPMKGYYYAPSKNIGYPDVLVECDCHIKWRQSSLLRIKAIKSEINVDPFSWDYSPSKDYIGTKSRLSVSKLATVIHKADLYKGLVLYCYGRPGTQKTTLLNWAGLEMLRANKTVTYYRMQKLNEALKPDIVRKSILGGYIEESDLLKKDLLIIDQAFMKGQVTISASGYQLPFIENFLRERIESKIGITIFGANSHPTEIVKNGFSESIQSFIIRNTVQKNTLLTFEDCYEGITNSIEDNEIEEIFDEKA